MPTWIERITGLTLTDSKTVTPVSKPQRRTKHLAFEDLLPIPQHAKQSPQALSEFLHKDVILADTVDTPFGTRPLLYADFIASGRSLRCVETAMMDHVMPYYANTHTDTGILGRCMTKLREDARLMIKNTCHATPEEYGCIFVGSGATAAINRLAHLVELPQCVSNANGAQDQLPVVFISSAEHHSNILVWRELGAKVVPIPSNLETGVIRVEELEKELKRHASATVLIGSFTAASNIVGILQPVHQLAKLMHKYNGLAFFDYACAGPYVSIEMSPAARPVDEHLDAVMVSPHKFLGGPGTPGILLVRKGICRGDGTSPTVPGGGSVTWVNGRGFQAYANDLETREEAGTPDILGAIRAGFVFQIKGMLTAEFIQERCFAWSRYAMERLHAAPNLITLGPPSSAVNKLPVFSVMIKSPVEDQFLHFHFVSKILSDVFGVQSRSGCSCAAPYFNELFVVSVEEEESRRDAFFGNGELTEGFKFGFMRFNLSYTHTKEEVDYILNAVTWVAENGWRMLPFYDHDPRKGTWTPVMNDNGVLEATVECESGEGEVEDFGVYAENALGAMAGVVMRKDWVERVRESAQKRVDDPHTDLLKWYAILCDISSFEE
ncbi:hypothetical protein HDU98_006481 [Podochytrium sp. JEL0797]|nr:hypothetical protein HDU98_006481 [Podochytrium sp. JEL0797]